MNFRNSAPVVALALLVTSQLARADDDQKPAAETANELTDFVRFQDEHPTATLQTSTVSFEDGNGLKVDLIGAIHIADKSYYEDLNKSFTQYDALLYEMVGSSRKGPLEPGDLDTAGKKGSPIRSLQVMMQKSLELSYQLNEIDYTAKNFVHADMDAATFKRMQKERKEGLVTMILQSYKAQFEMMKEGKAPPSMGIGDVIKILLSGDSASGLKLVLGRQFDEIEHLTNAMEPEGGSVILTERNKVAFEILSQEIKSDKKKIGVFYGAAHLPDMEERLINDFGLKKTKTVWNDAWSVKNPKK